MSKITVNDSLKKGKGLVDITKTINKDIPIKWYTCGPTIYDYAHIGHARTMITFDCIKRMLEYMGYTINYVMNITDIDDKIIGRVHQIVKSELFIISARSDQYLKNMLTDNGIITDFGKDYPVKQTLFESISLCESISKLVTIQILEKIVGNIDYQQLYNTRYYEFIKFMENDFWSDMVNIGVNLPTCITRVTDNIDNIIKYIQRIEQNGYCYVSNGSVYFDSQKFINDGHNIGPLLQNLEQTHVQEQAFISEKKHPHDFALWKAAKEGELMFESIYGPGRPGWHIECSVMATQVLGTLDIHSGGIDLLFPHHNNEIVQAVGHNNDGTDWVKHFLHSGHLMVNSTKMSKSLGNYVTIKDFLNQNSCYVLRLLFLLHDWDGPLDYNKDTIDEAKYFDKKISDYINNIDYIVKQSTYIRKNIINNADLEFQKLHISFVKSVKVSMKNNFNTKTIMRDILEIIGKTYVYLEKGDYNIDIITKNSDYIKEILSVFGIVYNNLSNTIDSDNLIQTCVDFRDDIRAVILSSGKENKIKLFEVIDEFRETKLKKLGIQLEDMGRNKPTKWKII